MVKRFQALLPEQKDALLRVLLVKGHVLPTIVKQELSNPSAEHICVNCGNKFSIAANGHCHFHPEEPAFDEEPKWSVPNEADYYYNHSKTGFQESLQLSRLPQTKRWLI